MKKMSQIIGNKQSSDDDHEPLPYNIQKELEAKFDELFGSVEEDNNDNES